MGIYGFLKLAKEHNILRPFHIKETTGKTVAIDMSCWIHMFGGEKMKAKTKLPINSIIACKLALLQNYDSKLLIVFDGLALPAKAETLKQRDITREKQGNKVNRVDHHDSIQKYCKLQSIPFVVAPYEADGQLVYLQRERLVDYIITCDSDFISHQCTNVIYYLKGETGLIYERSNIKRFIYPTTIWNEDMFQLCCYAVDSDYLKGGIVGVGFVTALKIYTECKEKTVFGNRPGEINKSTWEEFFNCLKEHVNSQYLEQIEETESQEWKQKIEKVFTSFRYQLVWDPSTDNIVPLTKYPKTITANTYPHAGDYDAAKQTAKCYWPKPSKIGKYDHECGECGAIFKTTKERLEHHKENHIKDCETCGKSILGERRMSYHKQEENKDLGKLDSKNEKIPEPIKCVICAKSITTPGSYKQHLVLVHGKRIQGYLTCKLCNFQTMYPSYLRYHISVKHLNKEKTHVCRPCNIGCKTKAYLKKHVTFHPDGNVHRCLLCGKSFENNDLLYAHNEEHHSPVKSFRDMPSSRKCKLCGYYARNKRHLHLHIQKEHLTDSQFVCQICDQAFKKKKTMKLHRKGHIVYRCKTCKAVFRHVYTYKNHIYRIHKNRKPNICKLCKRHSFTGKKNMIHHVLACHTNERAFCCLKCLKTFNSRSVLYKHKRYVKCFIRLKYKSREEVPKWIKLLTVPPVEKPYICQVPGCPVKTNTLTHIESHIENNHLFDIQANRRHKCTICDKVSFLTRGKLDIHKKSAHGKKPKHYACRNNIFSCEKKIHSR